MRFSNHEVSPHAVSASPQSLENFWSTNKWGPKLGLSIEQLQQLDQFSQEHYPDAAAHNYQHGRDALWVGMRWADTYEATFPKRPALKRKLLAAALLCHDMGKDEVAAAFQFMCYAVQPDSGFSEEENKAVQALILSSRIDREPTTVEEAIMMLADVSNVGDAPQMFDQRTEDFRREAQDQQGADFDESKFKIGTTLIILRYITKNISMLGGIEQSWIQQAFSNVRQRICEFTGEQRTGLLSLAHQLGKTSIVSFIEDALKNQSDSKSED